MDVQPPSDSDVWVTVAPFKGISRTQRRGITGITLGLMVLLAAILVPGWSGLSQQLWHRIFPPPPYTGPLLFVQDGANIRALRTSDGTTQWVSNDKGYAHSLVIAGDTLVFLEIGQLTGLRARDGKVLWHSPLPLGYSTPELSTDGVHLYAWLPPADNTSRPLFEEINRSTGRIEWYFISDGWVISTNEPADQQTLVFCNELASFPGTLFAPIYATVFDTSSGKKLWESPQVPSSSQQSSYCLATAKLVFLVQIQESDTMLNAYDRLTGTWRWKGTYPGSVSSFDANTIYYSTWNMYMPGLSPDVLFANDIATGNVRWYIQGKYTALFFQDNQPEPGNVIVMRTPVGIAGLDASTGNARWQLPTPGNDLLAWSVIPGDGDIIFYAHLTTLYALHATSGKVIWQMPLPGTEQDFQNLEIYYANHQLYLSDGAVLMAIESDSGRVRWQLPKNLQILG